MILFGFGDGGMSPPEWLWSLDTPVVSFTWGHGVAFVLIKDKHGCLWLAGVPVSKCHQECGFQLVNLKVEMGAVQALIPSSGPK